MLHQTIQPTSNLLISPCLKSKINISISGTFDRRFSQSIQASFMSFTVLCKREEKKELYPSEKEDYGLVRHHNPVSLLPLPYLEQMPGAHIMSKPFGLFSSEVFSNTFQHFGTKYPRLYYPIKLAKDLFLELRSKRVNRLPSPHLHIPSPNCLQGTVPG